MNPRSRFPENVFAGLLLDRNAEQRDDVDWIAAQLADPRARFVLLGAEGHALAQRDVDALRVIAAAERTALLPTAMPSYLGADEAGPFFALSAESKDAARIAAELGGDFIDLRSAGVRLKAFEAGLFAYARGLSHWQSRTRFCSVCGAPVVVVTAGHRARCTNPDCAIEHFPRVDPAMIVIVSYGDACLLGRQATWPERRYSTLAGFVEPGESLEDTVRREVFEEAGVRVGECAYHSSQPWPFPASLMVGFTAEALDPTIRLGGELAEARWFTADDIVTGLAERTLGLSPPVSVSFRLIEHWMREKAGIELRALVETPH
ncbi:MAG TPA: NAD(+) diphosphatase [Rhodanobacteraceae bacterium]|jgi:NAD+ diphosphatase|nr:NAD(+) diphosphatase [Rhodanobacteraceae bacterium]